jgi:hypothetical protein
MSQDPAYLAVKLELGEPLSPEQRATLEARRAAARAHHDPGGGP